MTWKAECPYCETTVEGQTEQHAKQIRVQHLWQECDDNRTRDWYDRTEEPYESLDS